MDAQLVELQDFLALGCNDRVAELLWRRAIDDLSLTGQQPSRFALSADLVEESFPVNKVPDLSLFDGIAPMEWVDRTSRSGLADTTLKLFTVGDGIWKRWRQNHFRLEQEESDILSVKYDSDTHRLLYHGTSVQHLPDFQRGIRPARGTEGFDFCARGAFYTAKCFSQAMVWATQKARNSQWFPVILIYIIPMVDWQQLNRLEYECPCHALPVPIDIENAPP